MDRFPRNLGVFLEETPSIPGPEGLRTDEEIVRVQIHHVHICFARSVDELFHEFACDPSFPISRTHKQPDDLDCDDIWIAQTATRMAIGPSKPSVKVAVPNYPNNLFLATTDEEATRIPPISDGEVDDVFRNLIHIADMAE